MTTRLLIAVLLVLGFTGPITADIVSVPLEPWNWPDCEGFFRSDVGLTVSGGVEEWEDLCPSGKGPLNQGTAANEPAYEADHFSTGVHGIHGDGSDDYLSWDSALVLSGEWTIAFLVDQQLESEGEAPFGLNNNNHMTLNGTFDDFTGKQGGAPYTAWTDAITHDDNPHYYVVCNDSSGNKTAYQDGTDVSPSVGSDTDNLQIRYFLSYNGTASSNYIFGLWALWNRDLCDDGLVGQLNRWLAEWSGI